MRLKHCPVADCTELIPLDAEDCGKHGRLCAACKVRPPRAKNAVYCVQCSKESIKKSKAQSYVRDPRVAEPAKKKTSKPIMSDAEQRAHDMALEVRLCQSRGYGHGEVRKLSRREIERIRGEITPIERVKNRSYTGYEVIGNWMR